MPLFGEKSQPKREALRAQRDAARAEYARLVALPPEDLAAELMPAFGADGAKTTDRSLLNPGARGGSDELQLVSWLHRNCRIAVPLFKDPSRSQVLQAVQVLEHAGLLYVEWMSDNGDRPLEGHEVGPDGPGQRRCQAAHKECSRRRARGDLGDGHLGGAVGP